MANTWYRDGTVTVTNGSTTVTGASTAFDANCKVGDEFIGPDGKSYEITNIASSTVISILSVTGGGYDGATASGQAYAIRPTQGYVKQSADRLSTITSSLMDGLDVSQGGTGATTAEDARTNLGALGATETAADSALLGGKAESTLSVADSVLLGGKPEANLSVADAATLNGKAESTLSVATAVSADNLGGYSAEQLAKASYNACRNPDCSVNQREATSVSAINEFIVDGFYLYTVLDGGTSSAVSSQADFNGQKWIKMSGEITGGGGTESYRTIQRLEMSKDSAEASYFSFDVYSVTGGTITVSFYNYYGVGGSTQEVRASKAVTVPAGVSRVSVPLDAVNYSTKTIGSGAYVHFFIYKQGSTSAHASDLYLTNFKIGYNDMFTPVDYISELLKCSRYFESLKASYSSDTGFGAGTLISTTQAWAIINYAEKFSTPDITISSGTYIKAGPASAAVSSINTAYKGNRTSTLILNLASSVGAAGQGCLFKSGGGSTASVNIEAEI